MIIKNKNILFVHIPKTGGQSIAKFFYEELGYTWNPKNKNKEEFLFLTNYDRHLPGPEVLVHMTAREYVDLGYVSEYNYNLFFKFSVVRNPYDKFLSAFKFNKVYEKYSIDEFVDNFPDDTLTDLYRHFAPQSFYIFDHDNNYLVDKILYFENLNEDFEKYIKTPFNLKNNLSKVNKTKYKKKNKISLTKKAIEFINNYYEKDFLNLRYKFL